MRINSVYTTRHFFILITLFLSPQVYTSLSGAPLFSRKKLVKIETMYVLPIHFDCYHLTAGGVREYDHTRSQKAHSLIFESIFHQLSNQNYIAAQIPDDSIIAARAKGIQRFYAVVNNEIRENVYGVRALPDAKKRFSYSLPPIPPVILNRNVDAILILRGFDDLSTPRRKRRKVGAAVANAVSVAALVVGGVGVFQSIPPDSTHASCALINREGDIVWYHSYSKTGSIDMTDKNDVNDFITQLLYGLSRNREEND